MTTERNIRLTVNGKAYESLVPVRMTLADFLRGELDLTGTHVGCEHGVCGACTILLDGSAVRSCLMLAVQADGASLMTVEGLAYGQELHPLQQAFQRNHALQCGFCQRYRALHVCPASFRCPLRYPPTALSTGWAAGRQCPIDSE